MTSDPSEEKQPQVGVKEPGPSAWLYFWFMVGLAMVAASVVGHNSIADLPILWKTLGEVSAAVCEHLGAGLIVAVIVARLLHIEEFTEFFASNATGILIKNEFLRKLSTKTREHLRLEAAKVSSEEFVDNIPRYDLSGIVAVGDVVLYNQLRPTESPGSGVYREKFEETTILTWMTADEMFAEIKKTSPRSDPKYKPGQKVLKYETTTSFIAVAPSRNQDKYANYSVPFAVSIHPNGIPGLQITDQLKVSVQKSGVQKDLELDVGGTQAGKSTIEIKSKGEDENLCFAFDENGEAKIWLRIVEYSQPEKEPFFFSMMGAPTRDAKINVHLVNAPASAMLSCTPFGLGQAAERIYRVDEPNRFELSCAHWFLKNQGYFVSW